MSSGPEDQWEYNWQEPRVCLDAWKSRVGHEGEYLQKYQHWRFCIEYGLSERQDSECVCPG